MTNRDKNSILEEILLNNKFKLNDDVPLVMKYTPLNKPKLKSGNFPDFLYSPVFNIGVTESYFDDKKKGNPQFDRFMNIFLDNINMEIHLNSLEMFKDSDDPSISKLTQMKEKYIRKINILQNYEKYNLGQLKGWKYLTKSEYDKLQSIISEDRECGNLFITSIIKEKIIDTIVDVCIIDTRINPIYGLDENILNTKNINTPDVKYKYYNGSFFSNYDIDRYRVLLDTLIKFKSILNDKIKETLEIGGITNNLVLLKIIIDNKVRRIMDFNECFINEGEIFTSAASKLVFILTHTDGTTISTLLNISNYLFENELYAYNWYTRLYNILSENDESIPNEDLIISKKIIDRIYAKIVHHSLMKIDVLGRKLNV